MTYIPGNIIRYKQNFGLKKAYYGIVIEEVNISCVRILTESMPEKVIQLFTDPKTTTSLSTIEKNLSIEEYSKIAEKEICHPNQKEYLLNIAKMLSPGNKTIVCSNQKYLETIANVVNI